MRSFKAKLEILKDKVQSFLTEDTITTIFFLMCLGALFLIFALAHPSCKATA